MKRERHSDVVIIGGGTGGCAAALAAARMGKTVIMTEETDWIGGQLTSQAVPPDEHKWIEQFGCTRTYRQFRDGVRDYYRRNMPLTPEARANRNLNPGNGNVSRICHEPRTALAVLQEMLAPYVHNGSLVVLTNCVPTAAETEGDRVRSVTVRHTDIGGETVLTAPYFLDATECGDLLPLTGTEYVTGSESQRETGEPHALAGDADPMDMQAITHCFAMDYIEGEDHTIEKPRDYEFWRSYQADFWPGKQLGMLVPHFISLEPTLYSIMPQDGMTDFWRYRRIIDKSNFAPGTYASDITLVNWIMHDYWLGPVIDVSEEERQRHLEGARQLSLSFFYWMQTEAPRPDGKLGYPGLRLRKDVVGTEDGLAKAVYIRESRRIRAEFTVLEQHIAAPCRGDQGAMPFHDTIGIGCYRMDLHPSTGQRTYIDSSTYPFQIPLGSLIPVRMNNLLPACKNIGTTHLTNGCYRLHPVEWNIGEAAGYLAAYCLLNHVEPRQVRNDAALLADFQRLLTTQGVELHWPIMHAV
ncbi:FAD-dependent oxidoreductase [Paenibacillus contaminans]|uniref:FAD-dependent oxidoreductase n=1 Tax=Paenibacillus contaminans TaxID=450362 RepID=A0A329LX97_9BACL|nr:FAD-dependent oxidoreductase [Paenibacillus contaminans]RAV12501.1 FAD-dependent oxidoreductase [Paenibacillus contaminans]